MPLTDMQVRKAKGRDKPYKLVDGSGLHLLVQPTGRRYWRFAYRFDHKQKLLALGVYPDVGLAEARTRRDDARRQLAAGMDPSHQRKLDKLTASIAAANTFEAVGDEWLDKRARDGRAASTLSKDTWLLRDLAYPLLGARPIKDITAPELLAVLRTVEARGRYETAAKLRQTCGAVFRYGIATGRAERDPTPDLRGALARPAAKHRAALLTEESLRGFLRAARDYDGKGITAFALQLAPLVFLRPGELRSGEWKDVNFEKAEWRIPAARMKSREEHIVPLSKQALAVLKAVHPITGRGPYIFPSLRSTRRPMSEGAILAALRRMGYAKDEVSGHGFRRTASTFLNEMGFNRDWIEKQLAHRERDEVRGAYNAAQYMTERRAMMQRWADWLDEIAEGATSANRAA